MNSAESSSRVRPPRKVAHTCSLTTNGSLYSLMSHTGPSSSPFLGVPSLPTPVAAPPKMPLAPSTSKTTPIERHMHVMMDSTPITSSERLYQPYIPVPRGPRSTNLYLYPPTKADHAQARMRRILKAAAIEDALRERADDERRRNEVLGISAPRKSTRKVRSKPAIVADRDSSAVNVKNTSSSASRRKPRPRLNPRPTPRLTTRSLTKAQTQDGGSGTGHSSGVPSEAADDATLDVEIKDLRETRDVAFPGVPPPDGGLQLMDVDLAPPEMRSEYDDNRASSSVESSLPSSDTLFEDAESVSLKAAVSHTRVAVKDIIPSQSQPPTSSIPPISSIARSPSPIPMMVGAPPTSTATTTKIGGKKRKQEQMDEASEIPPQAPPRRSSRVPKKRKLE